AGMVVSVIEFIYKSEDTMYYDIAIPNSEDQHHIVDCYRISPELLTEDFISKYGNYNYIKWFRAYKQL
ncbi:17849_t:CDS:2, partial [Funneliformis geosporum]